MLARNLAAISSAALATLILTPKSHAQYYLSSAESWVYLGGWNGGEDYHDEADPTAAGPVGLYADQNDLTTATDGSMMATLSGSVSGNSTYIAGGFAAAYPDSAASFGAWAAHCWLSVQPPNDPLATSLCSGFALADGDAYVRFGEAWVNSQVMTHSPSVMTSIPGNTVPCVVIIKGTGPSRLQIDVGTQTPDRPYEDWSPVASTGIAGGVFFMSTTLQNGIGDINGDGAIDENDADVLQAVAVAGAATNKPAAWFDMNSDGLANSLDIDAWLSTHAHSVRGDVDMDGDVDSTDSAIVTQNLGTKGFWSRGDFNGDKVVNSADLAYVTSNYGFGVP